MIKDRVIRDIILCTAILLVFCAGLYLGGVVQSKQTAALRQELKETRQMLESSYSSVIISNSVAEATGFKMRRHDLDMRRTAWARSGERM